jgi:hypothetical protein
MKMIHASFKKKLYTEKELETFAGYINSSSFCSNKVGLQAGSNISTIILLMLLL